MYSVQCTVYSVQCTVYSVQCTVYSVQYVFSFLPQHYQAHHTPLFGLAGHLTDWQSLHRHGQQTTDRFTGTPVEASPSGWPN